jgi:hypothetical protein
MEEEIIAGFSIALGQRHKTLRITGIFIVE